MIEWSKKYAIGEPRIDSQHEMLVGLIGDFEKARLNGASKDYLLDTLQEIVLYARFHFCSEENIMARMGYPNLVAHRELHFGLMDILNSKMVALRMGLIDPVEAQNFLVDWFANHIVSEDSKIVAFQKVQVSACAAPS